MGSLLARIPGRYVEAAKASVAPALHALSILCGWALLTHGIASLTAPEAWPLSGGLFLLSLAGWGHLRVLFTAGLYALSKAGER